MASPQRLVGMGSSARRRPAQPDYPRVLRPRLQAICRRSVAVPNPVGLRERSLARRRSLERPGRAAPLPCGRPAAVTCLVFMRHHRSRRARKAHRPRDRIAAGHRVRSRRPSRPLSPGKATLRRGPLLLAPAWGESHSQEELWDSWSRRRRRARDHVRPLRRASSSSRKGRTGRRPSLSFLSGVGFCPLALRPRRPPPSRWPSMARMEVAARRDWAAAASA
mmetsp:Transcript_15065/g.35642  ORF Transcript_15065/g.35642 Transcript_15065/m.35642 type:complete len:221 (-) Transcript_15065:1096-1758(-)